MWKRLRIWSGRGHWGPATDRGGTGGLTHVVESEPKPEYTKEEIPRWPPFRRGLPAVGEACLLETQREWIAKLRREAGVGEACWGEHYASLLSRYVGHVHLIPASRNHHHRGAGGLWRHGLEAAFYALRAGGEKVVGLDLPPSERKVYVERFRFCVFAAGLLHDVAKPVTDVVVTSTSGRVWNPLECQLVDWATANEVDRYYLRWRDGRAGRHEAVGALLLLRLLGDRTAAWVNAGGPEWLMDLSEAISGEGGAGNLLSELAGDGDRASVAADLKRGPMESDTGEVPVERWVLDAMRRLLREGRWRIGGGVAIPAEGSLALVWPRAGRDIGRELRESGLVGVPYEPDSLADLLLDCGIAEPASEEGGRRGRYWMLERRAESGEAVRMRVLRIARVESLLDPPPVSGPEQFVSPYPAAPTPPAGGGPAGGGPAEGGPAEGDQRNGQCSAQGQGNPSVVRSSVPASTTSSASPTAVQQGPRGRQGPGGQQSPEAQPVSPGQPSQAVDGTQGTGVGARDSEEMLAARQLFEALVQDIRQGVRSPGEVIRDAGKVYLGYPNGIKGYGYSPLDAAKLLVGAELVDRPDANRLVAQTAGGRGLWLTREAEQALVITRERLKGAVEEWFEHAKVEGRVVKSGRSFLPRKAFEDWLSAVVPVPGVGMEELVAEGAVVIGNIGSSGYVRLGGGAESNGKK